MDRLTHLIQSSAIVRFLLCGGTAAAINWFARIALSFVMPFEPAIVVAYAIGMTAGFLLYRHLVWPGQQMDWKAQVPAFLLVNAVGAGVVLGTAMGLERLGAGIFGPSAYVEAFAHGAAIAVGAVANYLGHSRITFAKAQRT
jgi:putative flippase GtrA